ncbi:MAG: ankyrin repeat domain-containing protein [Polyangiales bacterium]
MEAAELIQLVTQGDEQHALRVIEAEPNLATTRSPAGVSVVCLAMYRRRTALAAALAAARSDLDVFEAACVGDLARVKQLVSVDAEQVNAVSPDGFSPVGYAAFFGHAAVLEVLIARGGRVDVPSQNGMRVQPIHSAAAHADQAKAVALARIVLDAGADPNARQQAGFTALHEAAFNGNDALIALLLARGAAPGLLNDEGASAADLARTKGHAAALRLLEPDAP